MHNPPLTRRTFLAAVFLMAVLAVSGILLSHEGSQKGSATVATAVLPTITAQPRSLDLVSGNQMALKVSATSATPLSYQWYKDGVPVKGQNIYILYLPSVAAANAGRYHVVVTNDAGSVKSDTVTVRVDGYIPSVAPVIIKQPTASSVEEGKQLALKVTALGTAPLSYQWYRDGLPLKGYTLNVFYVASATSAHTGAYHVVVKDAQGSVTSDVVQVAVAPSAPVSMGLPSGVTLPAYFVSENGNDAWSGTEVSFVSGTAGPFRTLQRAQEAVRASGTIKRVYVRAGTYFVKGLTLDSRDSGVQLIAYPGETPVLSGGTPVEGWRSEGGGVWSAPVSSQLAKIGLVTINGEYYEPARYPNADDANFATTGWLFTENVVLQPGERSHPEWEAFPAYDFKFRPGDLSATMFAGEPEPMLLMWDKLGWKSEIYPISVDFSTRQVHVIGRIDFGIDTKTRYYIYNVKAALDKAGEFYHDRARARLFVIPKGLQWSGTGAVAAPYGSGPIIRITGAQNTLIKGFKIRDQHNTGRWGVREGGAILIENGASRNIVENNEIMAVGTGVWIVASAGEGNEIRGNKIHHVLTDGIRLFGPGNNTAIGNHIFRPGLLERFSKGINSGPVSNRIAHNLIEDTPHYGISAGADTANGILIEYNEIRRTNREALDCGAIYLKNGANYNPEKRETVRYNRISDVGGLRVNPDLTFTKDVTCWGIYLDASGGGGQSGTDIYGNIIVGAPTGAVMFHKGADNRVYNNVFVNGPRAQVYQSGTFAANNVIEKNIIAFTSPLGVILGGSPLKEGTWNNNLYWYRGAVSAASFFSSTDVTPRGTYEEWKAAGFDVNSKIADPRFKNWSGGDYALESTSPAFGLGFKAIPLRQIGLPGYRAQ